MNILRFLFRSLSATAVLALCFSCEKPAADPVSLDYRFDLSLSDALEASGFSWKTGDRVGLCLAGGTTLPGKVVEEGGRWLVTATAPTPIPAGTAVYPFYPYAGNSRDGSVQFRIDPEQQGDLRGLPLAGEPFEIRTDGGDGSNGTVRFRSMAALVDIRIGASGSPAGESIESVYLRTSNGSCLSGKATVKLTDATPDGTGPTLSGDDRHPHVNLTRASTVAPSVDEDADPDYLIVVPGVYSGTLTVVTGSATYTMPFPETAFTAGATQEIRIDLNDGKIRRTAPYNLENDRVAAFLDACEKNPYDPQDYSYTHVTAYYAGTGESRRLDLPKPVTLTWTNPAGGGGAKSVQVYRDPGMKDLELSVPVTDAAAESAQVYNLIPGRTWYYQVVCDRNEVAAGVFKTTGRRRMIRVAESPYGQNYANNCRDFGGQVTAGGQTIRYGKIFRGSNMDDTSAEARQFIRNYLKIGLDVDLRAQGSGTRGKYQFDPLSLGPNHTTETYGSWANLSDKTRMKTTLTRILSAVGRDTPVYIHCKVGADRTGYVCMLLEALLGIPQERCDIDYEMTSFSGAVGARTRTGVGNYYYVSKTSNGVKTVQGVDFINTFEGMTFQDKAINYVTRTLGVPRSLITTFQDKMLE